MKIEPSIPTMSGMTLQQAVERYATAKARKKSIEYIASARTSSRTNSLLFHLVVSPADFVVFIVFGDPKIVARPDGSGMA
jgi:hypothetical protein